LALLAHVSASCLAFRLAASFASACAITLYETLIFAFASALAFVSTAALYVAALASTSATAPANTEEEVTE
jgi:hypothetical protein